jgi:ATP-dependent Clp protease adaptor protein ClpS
MAEKEKEQSDGGDNGGGDKGGGVATAPPPQAKPKKDGKTKPKPKLPGMMPPWKVLLHNDDVNAMEFVIVTIIELTTLNEQEAILRTLEAHKTGVALLLVTHKERAELYQEQFQSKGLTVTIEADE